MDTNVNSLSPIIIGRLMRIGGILQREGNRLLAPLQLNHAQFSVLFEIWKIKKVCQKHMVNRLMLEKANVSKIIAKLARLELIQVKTLKEDRRATQLSITPQGKAKVKECQQVLKQWRQDTLEQLDSEQLSSILQSVDTVQDNLLSYMQQVEGK